MKFVPFVSPQLILSFLASLKEITDRFVFIPNGLFLCLLRAKGDMSLARFLRKISPRQRSSEMCGHACGTEAWD